MYSLGFRTALDAEFVRDVERALWRMRLFRFKHASLDRAAFRLLSSATAGVSPDRPLLLAVGNANFKPSGKGELPAPTSALSVALKRALQRVGRSQGRETLAMGVDELRLRVRYRDVLGPFWRGKKKESPLAFVHVMCRNDMQAARSRRTGFQEHALVGSARVLWRRTPRVHEQTASSSKTGFLVIGLD